MENGSGFIKGCPSLEKTARDAGRTGGEAAGQFSVAKPLLWSIAAIYAVELPKNGGFTTDNRPTIGEACAGTPAEPLLDDG
jgi:hypothetical protein